MSFWRRRTRRSKGDSNSQAIDVALKKVGASVQRLDDVGDGCPDRIVGFRGKTFLLEYKRAVETAKGRAAGGRRSVRPSDVKLRESQEKWHMAWAGGEVSVVSTPQEALRAIGLEAA